MLLIIFLGLISKLTSVSRGCDIGPRDVMNFDYNKYTGIWYWLLHTPNDFDDDYMCPITTYAQDEGNKTLVTADVYLISKQGHFKRTGIVYNRDNTGHWEEYYGEPYDIRVPIYVIAVDYDRYAIVKYCIFRNTKSYTFVIYRSLYPDQTTVKEMEKKLKENEIDINELIEYPLENCKEGDWTTEAVP